MRKARKKEHVENYLRTRYRGETLLEDVFLPHNALPELNFDDIETKTEFLGKSVDYPIIINAMTGGSEFSREINRDLSNIAREFNIPMAVGSQTIALSEDEESMDSFKVVRQNIGDNGVVIANLSAFATVEEAKRALNMIGADAIQLHLNPAQEVVMIEGDRNFKGVLSNIENIVREMDRPVIVKEVGFGISKEVAKKLYDVGVRYVDVAGSGGTNFIEIENIRYPTTDFSDLYSWGIPTALAVIKCRELPEDLGIIASGGIRTSLDIAKALVLGGDIVGISGEILSYLLHGGYENAREYVRTTMHKLKILMLLLGKENIKELRTVDYKLLGELAELANNQK